MILVELSSLACPRLFRWQAQGRFERLIGSMKQAQGRERLKEENALEWTERPNNIRACAKEIVNGEIIFV